MPTKFQIFKDELTMGAGLELFIGRKKQTISMPVRVEIERQHGESIDVETGSPIHIAGRPSRMVLRLYIRNKLFATNTATGEKISARIFKPLKGGPVQIHLVKKYTEIVER